MNDTSASARPYLLRALHEWMSDNGQTPHVIVDATAEGVSAPAEFVNEGRIVLNISWSATQNLQMDNDFVCFDARFSGAPFAVNFPVSAVQGIYSRESGQGMMFQDEPDAAKPPQTGIADGDATVGDDNPPPRGRPGLRVVK